METWLAPEASGLRCSPRLARNDNRVKNSEQVQDLCVDATRIVLGDCGRGHFCHLRGRAPVTDTFLILGVWGLRRADCSHYAEHYLGGARRVCPERPASSVDLRREAYNPARRVRVWVGTALASRRQAAWPKSQMMLRRTFERSQRRLRNESAMAPSRCDIDGINCFSARPAATSHDHSYVIKIWRESRQCFIGFVASGHWA